MPEFPADAAPREIVTALHDEMSRLPEYAALVADYRRTRAARRVPPAIDPPAFPRSPYQPRRLRLAAYAALRDAGNTPKTARLALGICPRTAVRYEAATKEGRS